MLPSTESTVTNEGPGRFFREAREARGLSLREAASIVGKHHSLLALEETGERKLPLDQVCRYPYGAEAVLLWAASLQPVEADINPACPQQAAATLDISQRADVRHVVAVSDGVFDDREHAEVLELKRAKHARSAREIRSLEIDGARRKAAKCGLAKVRPVVATRNKEIAG